MTRIGFIGLGNMGSGMAANLVRAGHQVIAFDLSKPALERARLAGCVVAKSAREAAEDATAVITMLPAGRHVREVMIGAVFASAAPDTLLIDCSTIDVATARALDVAAEEAGHAMVDAPVSGGIAAAEAGSLTFMVGGSDAAYARAEPILSVMGKTVIHAGGAGAGAAAKICNNMLLGASMIATCESFVLAQKLGLDPQTFFDIASKASGQCWSMTTYCPLPGIGPVTPADRNYEGGFAAALQLKDLKLAIEAAQSVDAAVPMGSEAQALYQAFVNLGGGSRDFSAIIKLIDGSWQR
jgi:3-hydroxyisobutyrate dehydrogenase